MAKKFDNPSVGETFGNKTFQCIDLFRFENGDTKCTFLRKENQGTKDEPKWVDKTFYHVVNGLPENAQARDIVLKTSNIIDFAE